MTVSGTALAVTLSGSGTVSVAGTITVSGTVHPFVTADKLVQAELGATGNIEITAGANRDLGDQVNLTMKATAQASLEGSVAVSVKGATAALEGTATTTVKGGIVMIN